VSAAGAGSRREVAPPPRLLLSHQRGTRINRSSEGKTTTCVLGGLAAYQRRGGPGRGDGSHTESVRATGSKGWRRGSRLPPACRGLGRRRPRSRQAGEGGSGECGTRSRVTAVTCCVQHVEVECGVLYITARRFRLGLWPCGLCVHGFGQPMEMTAEAFVLVTFCKDFLVIIFFSATVSTDQHLILKHKVE